MDLQAAKSYFKRLPATIKLNIRSITPKIKSKDLNQPIIISGNLPEDDQTESEALILDMRSLPTGSTLQIENIAFALVFGDTAISSGPESSFLIADEQKQQLSLGDGNDTLIAGGSDDTIRGESGNDVLNGYSGNDLMFGGSQNDTLIGGLGADNLKGGSSDDKLNGKKGKDTLIGQKGDDTIRGRRGNDILLANTKSQAKKSKYDDNILRGGMGDDTLKGGNGNDKLIGGRGDDVLISGQGDNRLQGNSGADQFILSTGKDIIIDFQIKDGDQLNVENFTNISISQQDKDLLISTNAGDLYSIIKNLGRNDLLSHQPELIDKAL